MSDLERIWWGIAFALAFMCFLTVSIAVAAHDRKIDRLTADMDALSAKLDAKHPAPKPKPTKAKTR